MDLSAEPEFANRYEFEFERADDVSRVGHRVLFFGFPFGSSELTSHVGYISADYRTGAVHRLPIDGSINPGISGGPLVHLESGKVVGIVTQTQTGLERDFDALLESIAENEKLLSQQQGARMTIGGIDPVQATRLTMTILRRVATKPKRSANVGLGWAFCCEHIQESGAL